MSTERFYTYNAEDFVIDDEFRRMVYDPNSDTKIKEFLVSFPIKKNEISMAVAIIKSLHLNTLKQSSQRKVELWDAVLNETKDSISFFF